MSQEKIKEIKENERLKAVIAAKEACKPCVCGNNRYDGSRAG